MSATSISSPQRSTQTRTIPFLRALPIPLMLVQPILATIGSRVASGRPELFERLGHHAQKCFVIDPIDLPFVLALRPVPEAPKLTAHRRSDLPAHDACIAGSFINLFDMIDGALDGDALFFSRDLRITGDIEAAVALRNALDDLDGSIFDDVGTAFGPFSKPAALAIAGLRSLRGRSRS
ncbi:MAG: sterol-binding protein [Xanthobacteraceae bacterium]|nr:MAG: sterol-binding protein [Xanthobacteraceae bacterium]